jgi:hypothetical protein
MPRRALLFLLLASCPAGAAPSRIGDFRHDYLYPEERRSPVNLFGFFGASWAAAENGGGSEGWTTGLTERAASGIWLAGSTPGRISYFAEAGFAYDAGEVYLGQARADLRVIRRYLSVRAGRFLFPFGVEARGAPHRVSRFILRPLPRSGPQQGVGVLGEVLGGRVNYSGSLANAFPSALADTLFGPSAGGAGEALGGRIGVSPGPGLEIGASYAEQGGASSASIRGLDFSARQGPILLTAEWARLRRSGGSPGRSADLAYGRLSHRIVEFGEHLDAVEILLGAEYIDPDKSVSGDRELEYLGGVSVSPRAWATVKAEYHARDREGDRRSRIVAEGLLLW